MRLNTSSYNFDQVSSGNYYAVKTSRQCFGLAESPDGSREAEQFLSALLRYYKENETAIDPETEQKLLQKYNVSSYTAALINIEKKVISFRNYGASKFIYYRDGWYQTGKQFAMQEGDGFLLLGSGFCGSNPMVLNHQMTFTEFGFDLCKSEDSEAWRNYLCRRAFMTHIRERFALLTGMILN